MTKQTAYLSYLVLTPNFKNIFFGENHAEIINILRKYFFNWKGIFDKYGDDFSIGFILSRKKGTETVTIFGPSVSKKMKLVDYSIFLPDEINSLDHYIDLVFEGIGIVLTKFSVSESEIANMKAECKSELGLT